MCISSEKIHERNIVMKIRTARLEEIPEIMKILRYSQKVYAGA